MTKPKILIVEDAKIAQLIAKNVLLQLGCHVDTADEGTQAVELAKINEYDLILMDLGLPNHFDGFQVTQALRKFKYYQSIPIIALTAHIEDEYAIRAKEVGMNDFLIKPLSEEKAKSVLEKFIPTSNTNEVAQPVNE